MSRSLARAVACIAVFAAPAGVRASDAVRVDEGRQPQVAVTAERVYVAYAKDDAVYCAASADGGRTYAEPVRVARPKNVAVGMRRGPRIAASGATAVITAIAGERGGGKDGDVLSWRSADGGRTWAPVARPVNSVAGAAREGLHAMAAGPGGELFCAWLDLRNARPGGGGTEVWGARSTDGGATWSADVAVYRSPERTVCECCHPSVAFAADGTLAVMFRNALGGRRDMYVVRSADGGRTFGTAQKLGAGTWQLDACPMDGGMLAFADAERGGLLTAWRRGGHVFAASPGEPERQLGAGLQPWLAAGPGGTFAVWVSARPGDLMLSRDGGPPVRLAAAAADPTVAAGPDGVAVVAWETEGRVMAQAVNQPK
jgi:hypothetical protein